MELEMPNQSVTQQDTTLILAEMRVRRLEREQNRLHQEKQQKIKQKLGKFQPKEQLKILQKQRVKMHTKRHTKLQEPESVYHTNGISTRQEDLDTPHTELFVNGQGGEPEQVSLDRIIVQQSVGPVATLQPPLLLAQSLQQTPIDIEKDHVILVPETSLKMPEIEQVQQEILPQTVVLVPPSVEKIPETGIMAYNENGHVVIIREADIETVNSYNDQHFVHTYDGAVYVIDANAEPVTLEPTYLVWEKPLEENGSFVIAGMANVVVTNEEATMTNDGGADVEVTDEGGADVIVTDEGAAFAAEGTANSTYGIQDWDDFEIYQAMTAFRIAETSETNSVLAQPPIMSTVENPTRMVLAPPGYRPHRKLDEPVYTSQSLEDSLAQIGVITTEASNIPHTLQLPSTVTDPTITSTILSVAHVEEDDDSNTVDYTSNDYWQ